MADFRRVKELREENAEVIAQKRAAAEDAVLILERTASTKAKAEREKHGAPISSSSHYASDSLTPGLVILSAHYGLKTSFTSRGMQDPSNPTSAIIDVTIPLQALVNDGKLIIPGGRAKYNLLGFYDPCIGEAKVLRVRYLFKDVVHEVTIPDTASLRIPVQGEHHR